MNTKKVKASDLLNYPLPVTVKGRNAQYLIVRIKKEGNKIQCWAQEHLGYIPTINADKDGFFDVVITEQNTDHLLDKIGELHTRNKSLQKGHATLTRRVQELEEQNEELKKEAGYCVDEGCDHSHILHKCYSGRELSDRAVDGSIADEMKPEITAADVNLQADINEVHKRLHALERRTPSAEDIGNSIHENVERMLQPGGLLYRILK